MQLGTSPGEGEMGQKYPCTDSLFLASSVFTSTAQTTSSLPSVLEAAPGTNNMQHHIQGYTTRESCLAASTLDNNTMGPSWMRTQLYTYTIIFFLNGQNFVRQDSISTPNCDVRSPFKSVSPLLALLPQSDPKLQAPSQLPKVSFQPQWTTAATSWRHFCHSLFSWGNMRFRNVCLPHHRGPPALNTRKVNVPFWKWEDPPSWLNKLMPLLWAQRGEGSNSVQN